MSHRPPPSGADHPALTRRQVLQTLGACGGSSLVMGALDAWALMGAPAGRQPQLEGSGGGTRVAILGAGLSGLVVGYELGKRGYDCRLLEARDFEGGLCWTVTGGDEVTELGGERQVCRFEPGQYLNAGAWRLPHGDEGILGYCKQLSVPLEIFVDTADANYFYDERAELGPLTGRRVRLRDVRADLWGSTSELLAKALDQGALDVPLSAVDRERLVTFLVRAGYLETESLVYTPPPSRGDRAAYDLSALLQSEFGNRAATLYAGIGGPAPVFQPVGGMMEIPRAFAREIGSQITYEAEVRSVHQTPDDVRITYQDIASDVTRELTADYCVCCLPMAVTQRLDLDVSSTMQDAINECRHSVAAKMGLQMKRRFWEEDDGIFGGHLWARDLQLGEFSYPSNGFFGDKGVLLGFYGDGQMADLADRTTSDRIEHVLSRASRVHPQMRAEFETAFCAWWQNMPYSRGAYSRTPAPDLLNRLSQADGRIYLASAGASSRPAWLEGAVQAAWRTVEAVHQRVMQG